MRTSCPSGRVTSSYLAEKVRTVGLTRALAAGSFHPAQTSLTKCSPGVLRRLASGFIILETCLELIGRAALQKGAHLG